MKFRFRLGWLSVLALFGYILSFGSQMVISYYFGTSTKLDAYWTVFAVANFALFFAHPLREALITPTFLAFKANKRHASSLFSAGLVTQICFATVSVVILIFLPSRVWEGLNVTVLEVNTLILFFLPFIWIFSLSEICNGLLLSFNKVVSQSVIRILAVSFSLLTLSVLAGRVGIFSLVISLLVAQVITFILSLVMLKREGVSFVWQGFSPLWRERKFFVSFLSLLLCYFMAQGYVLFERAIMLKMQPGLVASFQYSTSLVNILISLLVYPVMNLLWPRFMSQQNDGNQNSMVQLAFYALSIVLLVVMFCCVFTYIFSSEIVHIVYSRGEFDASAVMQTSKALEATIFTAIPIATYSLLSRVMLTSGHSKHLAVSAVLIAIVGVLFIYIASFFENVELIRWHWLVSNSFGSLALIAIVIYLFPDVRIYIYKAILWISKLIFLLIVVGFFIPKIEYTSDKFQLILELGARFLLSGLVFFIFSNLMGLFFFRSRRLF